MNRLSIFAMFATPKVPTAAEQAVTELAEAERQLLKAQSEMEHATASVSYNKNRVARLSAYVKV